MIMVLIVVWLGFLWLLVKVGVLKGWSLWMKISPFVIWLVSLLVIFLPLNWNAPKGAAAVTIGSVGIKPSVSGPVTKVIAKSWTPIAKGDVLFEIDKTVYEAALLQAKSQLTLARDTLARKEELLSRNTVAQAEVDRFRANVASAEAAVAVAEFNLDNTIVRAPFDGIVPAMTLLPGNQVSQSAAVLAFLDIQNPVVNLILSQNQMRNVEIGQQAEATFKALPGVTFVGVVNGIYLSSPDAEYQLDGATPEVPVVNDTTYVVTLDLDLKGAKLPPGSSGQGVVYTDQGIEFQVIQQITLRTTAWMNYF